MIDTHAHLYLKDFKTDIAEVVDRAQLNGVNEIYLPAIDQSEHNNLLELENRFPEIFRPMMGLHPCSVKENYIHELEIVEKWLGNRKFYGIGETGLDYYWDTSFKEQQIIAFEKQINWAKELNIPVIIHSRNSIDDCISLIEKHQDGSLSGVFHCFTGNREQAKTITALGFFLGIGGVLTYKKSGLAEVLSELNLDNIVLETDAPYLTPVPFRGKRNESSYLSYIAAELARVKNLNPQEIASVTSLNAKKLFKS